MVLVIREEAVLRGVRTILGTISTSAYPGSDSNPYLTDVQKVYPFYMNPHYMQRDDIPALFVSPVAIAEQQQPARQTEQTMTIAIGGVVRESAPRTKPEDSNISTDLMSLWGDVRRALLADINLGGRVKFTRVLQSEFDEGIAYPLAWFVLTIQCEIEYPASNMLVEV